MSKGMSKNVSGKSIRKKSIGGKLQKKQSKIMSVERKVAALDTLASGIAQEFNEILTAIMGYVEMALLDSPKDSSVKKNLKHAMEAAERAKDLINDLQVFSRQKEMEQKTFQIGGFVKEILNRFQKSLPKQIALQSKIMVDAENVKANPNQIQQIVVNLCTNACNAMLEKGGMLSVALEPLTIGAKNNHRSLNPGAYFCLTVSDTGKGIDEDIRDRIFDPYFTTNRTGSGYGMGLAIVQSIVDALRGFIELESSKQKGTIFRVFLPAD